MNAARIVQKSLLALGSGNLDTLELGFPILFSECSNTFRGLYQPDSIGAMDRASACNDKYPGSISAKFDVFLIRNMVVKIWSQSN